MFSVFLLLCFVPTEGRRSQADLESETATNGDEYVWNIENEETQYWNPTAKEHSDDTWAGGDAKKVQGTIGGKAAAIAKLTTRAKNKKNALSGSDLGEKEVQYVDEMKAKEEGSFYALILGFGASQCQEADKKGFVGFQLDSSFGKPQRTIHQNVKLKDMKMKKEDFASLMLKGGTLQLHKGKTDQQWKGTNLCTVPEWNNKISKEEPVWKASLKEGQTFDDKHLCSPKVKKLKDHAKKYINDNSNMKMDADGKSPTHKVSIPFQLSNTEKATLYMKYTCDDISIQIEKIAVYTRVDENTWGVHKSG